MDKIVNTKVEDWRNISGEFYQWINIKKPERPYIHDYSRTMVMKLDLSIPDGQGGTKVFCNFEKALDIIKKVNVITLSIPKIVYLVGWQFNGHDDKYPSWAEVNVALKRDEDETAAQSLRWLMEEAYNYNTTVSLHINMTDAYKDSPLWDTYVENDLISKNEDGSLKDIGTWNNKTAYQVFYKNEWEKGFAVKRIDELLNMLPIEKAGTIHIDAFFCRPSEGHNVKVEEEQEYRRKIFRYWRDRGIDVTSEFVYREAEIDDLVGIQPMAWWFNQDEKDYMERPANLFCGGQINSDLPGDMSHEFLFGTNMHGEGHFSKDNWEQGFLKDFCLRTAIWYYLNSFDRKAVEEKNGNKVVGYSDGLSTVLPEKIIKHNDFILCEGENVFVPTLWSSSRQILAYSTDGYVDKSWRLPDNWTDVITLNVYDISKDGVIFLANVHVQEGRVSLSVLKGQTLILVPENL